MDIERKNDREALRWSLGVWLACLAHAIVLILVSQFDYRTAMTIWRVANLLLLTGCFCLWQRSKGQAVGRPFIIALGILSVIVVVLSLIPTGVTEWG